MYSSEDDFRTQILFVVWVVYVAIQLAFSLSVHTAVKGLSLGVLPPGTSKSPRRSRSMRYAAVCARLRIWIQRAQSLERRD